MKEAKEFIIVGFSIVALFVSAIATVKVNTQFSEKKQTEKVDIKEVEFQTIALEKKSMIDNTHVLKVITKGKDGKNYSFIVEGKEVK